MVARHRYPCVVLPDVADTSVSGSILVDNFSGLPVIRTAIIYHDDLVDRNGLFLDALNCPADLIGILVAWDNHAHCSGLRYNSLPIYTRKLLAYFVPGVFLGNFACIVTENVTVLSTVFQPLRKIIDIVDSCQIAGLTVPYDISVPAIVVAKHRYSCRHSFQGKDTEGLTDRRDNGNGITQEVSNLIMPDKSSNINVLRIPWHFKCTQELDIGESVGKVGQELRIANVNIGAILQVADHILTTAARLCPFFHIHPMRYYVGVNTDVTLECPCYPLRWYGNCASIADTVDNVSIGHPLPSVSGVVRAEVHSVQMQGKRNVGRNLIRHSGMDCQDIKVVIVPTCKFDVEFRQVLKPLADTGVDTRLAGQVIQVRDHFYFDWHFSIHSFTLEIMYSTCSSVR